MDACGGREPTCRPDFPFVGGKRDFYFQPEGWIRDLNSRVEARLEEVTASDLQLINDVGRHMLFGYAKRLRPLFVLLGMLFFKDEISEEAIDCAVAAELIHCATLFHDDVIDGAERRKGRMSANAIWGNKTAVIMGDYFFVVAYNLLSAQRDLRLLDIFVDTCRFLARGVMLEIKHTRDPNIDEATHTEIIKCKTAVFFSKMAMVGGYLGGADESMQMLLEEMGLNFGMAFQLSDDLMDLYASPSATGKPRGSDLRSGIYTTAVIRSMKDDPSFVERFYPLFGGDGGEFTSEKIDEIAEAIRKNGSLDYTLSLIDSYCCSALGCLEKLPDGRAKQAIQGLVGIIRERRY